MKVIVVGLGSMGKRRIRLLKKIDDSIEIIGVDGKEERRQEVSKLFGIRSYASIQATKCEENITCAFVCTSPLSHNSIIRECLQNKWNVFTELNLVSDGYEENMKLARENNCTLFLSSTFFYRDEVSFIRKEIQGKKNLNYIYHIGQYLPDWHPWENYKDFFIGDERTNGCREILAIELPWLVETFGEIKDINVITDKMSQLKITYNDNYMIHLEHEDGNKGALIVDVVCPKAVRNFEVYGENVYLSWDGTPTSLKWFDPVSKKIEDVELYEHVDQIKGYSSFVVENAYQNEIQEFLKVVQEGAKQQYGFEKDLIILKHIDKIEGKNA